MGRLTTKLLNALEPRPAQYEIGEPGGLRARVYPSGRVALLWRYRDSAGRQRVVTLGTYPAVSLAQARIELAKAQAARGTGADPAEAREERRREQRRRALGRIEAPTLADLAGRYLEDFAARVHRGERSAVSLYETRRLLDKHVLPLLGRERASEVTRQDVRALLRRVTTTASPVIADRVLVALRALLNHALEEDAIASNPAARIRKRVGRTERDRVLSDAEIAALWAELDRRAGEPLAWAVKLALVTAARRSSIVLARWDELSGALWEIPAAHFKGARAHLLPLSSLAIEVLAGLRQRTGLLPVLFPGASLDTPAHPGSFSRHFAGLARNLGIDAHVHDLRRTAATLMRAAGVPRDDVASVLGHADGTVAGRHYDKHDGLPERATALERLADAIRQRCGLARRQSAKVLPLGRHG
jgi:integrase